MLIKKEHIPLEEVFQLLKTSSRGLSSTDAAARLQLFGCNKLEETPVTPLFFLLEFNFMFSADSQNLQLQFSCLNY